MEASAEPPEVKRTGRNWLDSLLALSAIIVSLTSLYLAYNSNDAMQRLVHASSWPFLQLETGNTDDDRTTPLIGFMVKNADTGPARVHSFEMLVDGHPIAQPDLLVKLLQACCNDVYEASIPDSENPYATLGAVYTRPVSPGLVAVNDEVVAFAWPRTEQNQRLWYAFDQARQRGRISMRACYCSVFDECWDTEVGQLPSQRINVCEANAGLTANRD